MLAERDAKIGTWATNFMWTYGEQRKVKKQFRTKKVGRDPT